MWLEKQPSVCPGKEDETVELNHKLSFIKIWNVQITLISKEKRFLHEVIMSNLI